MPGVTQGPTVVYVPYLHRDPLVAGEEVEFAALKHTGDQTVRGFPFG